MIGYRNRVRVISHLAKHFSAWLQSIRDDGRIRRYQSSGRKPWTPGYEEHKIRCLRDALEDEPTFDLFRNESPLPPQYGFRIDERIVEYPWLFSRLTPGQGFLLDAGSVLNFDYILDHPVLQDKSVVIYNLAPETVFSRSHVSYIYGDLRDTILKQDCFDEIACISTLEHIGMDNTLLYSEDARFEESNADDYLAAIAELRRLLKSGGKLFLTVPYGRYENLGWLQQFDEKRIESVMNEFKPASTCITYYKYAENGWQISDCAACANCSYFDTHSRSDYEPDYLAAARAVACLELVK